MQISLFAYSWIIINYIFENKSAKNSVNFWLINRTSACDQHRLTKMAPTKSALLFIINVCTIAHLHAYEYSMILFILINTLSLVSSPLTFNGKNMTKPHTKWLQDIEIFVYLPIFSLNSSHAVRDLGRVRQYPPWLLFAAFVESVGCPRYNPQKTRKQWHTRDRRFHWLWGWFPDLKIIFMM